MVVVNLVFDILFPDRDIFLNLAFEVNLRKNQDKLRGEENVKTALLFVSLG